MSCKIYSGLGILYQLWFGVSFEREIALREFFIPSSISPISEMFIKLDYVSSLPTYFNQGKVFASGLEK